MVNRAWPESGAQDWQKCKCSRLAAAVNQANYARAGEADGEVLRNVRLFFLPGRPSGAYLSQYDDVLQLRHASSVGGNYSARICQGAMSEPVQLGRVTCDFMNKREFSDICQHWICGQAFHHIVTLNPEMIMLAERDNSFREAVAAADIRVPDGAGLVWARWYLRSRYWP